MPVADLAAKDSALFLWATFPQLPEALRLIQAWGFTYKSVAFVWLKQNRKSPGWFYGLGFWTRGNAEVCCWRHGDTPKRQGGKCPSVLSFPLFGSTARKPEEAREKDRGPYGRLTQGGAVRKTVPARLGVWGNEVEPTIPDFWTKCPEEGRSKGGLVSGLTLGSLFDGIGVFPLAASAVRHPPPVGKRDRGRHYLYHPRQLPDMAHLGDITKTGRRGHPSPSMC